MYNGSSRHTEAGDYMNQRDEQKIISASSAVRSPAKLFNEMKSEIFSSFELGYFFFKRDLQASYRESFLGFFWTLTPAIALAAGLTLAVRADLINVGPMLIPYPIFVIIGMTIWQLFTESIEAPVNAISRSKPLLTKIRFPREALFIAGIANVLFNLLLKSVVVLIILFAFKIPFGPNAWLAPFALIPVAAAGLTLGFALIPFSILFQDGYKAVSMLTSYWLFLTPVAFQVPEKGLFREIVLANPLTPLVSTVRDLITSTATPMLFPYLIVSFVAVLAVLLSWIVVYISMPILIERISA